MTINNWCYCGAKNKQYRIQSSDSGIDAGGQTLQIAWTNLAYGGPTQAEAKWCSADFQDPTNAVVSARPFNKCDIDDNGEVHQNCDCALNEIEKPEGKEEYQLKHPGGCTKTESQEDGTASQEDLCNDGTAPWGDDGVCITSQGVDSFEPRKCVSGKCYFSCKKDAVWDADQNKLLTEPSLQKDHCAPADYANATDAVKSACAAHETSGACTGDCAWYEGLKCYCGIKDSTGNDASAPWWNMSLQSTKAGNTTNHLCSYGESCLGEGVCQDVSAAQEQTTSTT